MTLFALTLLMGAAADEPSALPAQPLPIVEPPPIISAPPPPPPPLATVVSTPAKPSGSSGISSLFSIDDYPIEAIRAEEEGTTQVRLSITAEGRVGDCQVIWSSGSAALDKATCAVLRQRARFMPALDAQGHPTADYLVQRVHWDLPDEFGFDDWSWRDIVKFDAKGRPSGCRIESHDYQEDPSECGDLLEEAQGLVYGHPDLGKRPLSIVFESRFEASPAAPPPSIGSRAGEQLIDLQVAEFDIDPAGSVVNCRVTLRRGAGPQENLCEYLLADRYDPLPSTAPQATRQGRRTTATYLKR